jgi:hypothetical protein
MSRKLPMYNGHKNRHYWNVSLWINNDEGLYNLARDYVQDSRRAGFGMDYAARMIKEVLPEKTPDGSKYSIANIKEAIKEL